MTDLVPNAGFPVNNRKPAPARDTIAVKVHGRSVRGIGDFVAVRAHRRVRSILNRVETR